ncbi:type IV pilus modification protein PilV [Comamonas thiooxydans]|uniref:type IV pilus modification protein PilV n=1 Tax=Comamonas thiooxydans TaxID=363952 RepID=UPI0009C0667C|nr:type IV pilus modification protein PilV [Comamonas thiooxydans]
MRLTHTISAKKQLGITLLESLIAIVVAALGILGILGVQMRTLTDTQTSMRRTQAIRLIEDLSERMKVNPNALLSIGDYTSTFTKKAADYASADCSTAACTPSKQASFDLKIWKTTLQQTLPLGQAQIFLAPGESASDGNRRQLGVIIAWRENEQDGAKADIIDASKIKSSDGKFENAGGDDNACPENFICHLQYISVSARCAPYGDSSNPTVYCS